MIMRRIVGAVAVTLAGIVAERAVRRFLGKDAPDGYKSSPHAGAFRDGETDPTNREQTRNAGPESTGDKPKREWTSVDQAIDESFPSSDPPSHSPGIG